MTITVQVLLFSGPKVVWPNILIHQAAQHWESLTGRDAVSYTAIPLQRHLCEERACVGAACSTHQHRYKDRRLEIGRARHVNPRAQQTVAVRTGCQSFPIPAHTRGCDRQAALSPGYTCQFRPPSPPLLCQVEASPIW